MITKRQQLENMVTYINDAMLLNHELRINRRNGYYAIDKYDLETSKFVGFCFCGNFIETYHFLQGMQNCIWLSLPF